MRKCCDARIGTTTHGDCGKRQMTIKPIALTYVCVGLSEPEREKYHVYNIQTLGSRQRAAGSNPFYSMSRFSIPSQEEDNPHYKSRCGNTRDIREPDAV